MDDLDKMLNCTGFQWHKGNAEKSWLKHGVSNAECEEIFFNQPLLAAEDTEHSLVEKRYHALGRTDEGRLLFVSLTIRKDLIRVISARDMSRKERTVYEEAQKADTEI